MALISTYVVYSPLKGKNLLLVAACMMLYINEKKPRVHSDSIYEGRGDIEGLGRVQQLRDVEVPILVKPGTNGIGLCDVQIGRGLRWQTWECREGDRAKALGVARVV